MVKNINVVIARVHKGKEYATVRLRTYNSIFLK